MKREMKKTDYKGQAVVEALLILPFLFVMMLWLMQYFQAIHKASIQQVQARHELWKSVDNWRDLRDRSRDRRLYQRKGGFAYGLANDQLNKKLFSNGKTSLTIEVTSKSSTTASTQGADSRGSQNRAHVTSRTVVGICRNFACK